MNDINRHNTHESYDRDTLMEQGIAQLAELLVATILERQASKRQKSKKDRQIKKVN